MKKWLWIGASIVGLALAVWLLWCVSRYLDKAVSDPVQFVTGNLLNALVFAAIVGQLYIYRKQWIVMDRSLVKGTRAYVGIHSVEPVDFETKRMFIEIENIGKVPADRIKVDFKMQVRIAIKCIPDEYIPSQWSEPGTPNILTVPRHYDYGRSRLSPGNFRIKIPVDLARWFTGQELSLVKKGDAWFIIRGNINFEDGFNKGKNSPFAVRFSHQDKCWVPHPIMTPEEEREYYEKNPYHE